MSHRFFSAPLAAIGDQVVLDESAARHARVLRVRAGDAVTLFDGQGNEADAEIVDVSEGAVVCRVVGRASRRARSRIVLVQAVTKGKKLETIVRMTTELGVVAVHLALTSRVVARPSEARAEGRVGRLERIAREAARQANRSEVPEVFAPAPLDTILSRLSGGGPRIVFWEESKRPLNEALERNAIRPGEELFLVIGPEGGLAEAEIAMMGEAGFVHVGLGPQVLRVETAAPVAVALVLDRMGALQPEASDTR